MKKIAVIILSVIFFLGIGSMTSVLAEASTAKATPTSSSVLIDGSAVSFQAYNIDGYNYFKLRDIAQAITGTAKQFEIGYDETTNAITLTSGMPYTSVGGELAASADTSARQAAVSAATVYLDDVQISLDAYLIDGNNYFKLRNIGAAIDFGVTWDGMNNTISIDTSSSYVSDTVYSDITEFLAIFDADTAEDIMYALEDIGMDTACAADFYYYGQWLNGKVFSFTYENSVIDLLMNSDGSVFSVETMGVQIYLAGYGSYWIDDYLGCTTHYDKNRPDDGYFFHLEDPYTTIYGWLNITTGSEYDYVVKLVDADDETLVMAFYIYGGHEDYDWYWDVPPGDYYIEYAAGTTWYGMDELFGSDTAYYIADDIYTFYDGEDVYITLDFDGGGIPSTDITSEYN